jgi:hypothetical protein
MGDSLPVGVQLDIITNASAKRARGVLHDGQFHPRSPLYRWIWPSEPDGMTNVQPSALPLLLPLIRRGMYRPVETSSQAGVWLYSASPVNCPAVAVSISLAG